MELGASDTFVVVVVCFFFQQIVSGSSSAHLPRVPIFLPRDVPQLYVQVESLLRQLRVHNRRHQEGKQQVFYSTQELMGIFKKPLHQIQCSEENFVAALQFIGQVCPQQLQVRSCFCRVLPMCVW